MHFSIHCKLARLHSLRDFIMNVVYIFTLKILSDPSTFLDVFSKKVNMKRIFLTNTHDVTFLYMIFKRIKVSSIKAKKIKKSKFDDCNESYMYEIQKL